MSTFEIDSLANFAQIISAGTIVTGVIFGILQIRYYRTEQRNAVATEIMQSFYSRDMAESITLIRRLPDGISAEELRAMGEDVEEAAISVSMTFETMGLLLHKEIAPEDLVIDLVGGLAPVIWRKLENWEETVRVEQDHPTWAEWFQWLAQYTEDIKLEREPAFIAHKDWRPRQKGLVL